MLHPTEVPVIDTTEQSPWVTPELRKVDIATGTLNALGPNDDGHGPGSAS